MIAGINANFKRDHDLAIVRERQANNATAIRNRVLKQLAAGNGHADESNYIEARTNWDKHILS